MKKEKLGPMVGLLFYNKEERSWGGLKIRLTDKIIDRVKELGSVPVLKVRTIKYKKAYKVQ